MGAESITDTRRDEKAIAFFGSWAILGLHLDGWAHIHDKPEDFFTPWHGVLYSGVTVAVIYYVLRDLLGKTRSPGPDGLTTWGFVLFSIGAGGDFVWHAIFGIEVDIDALLSPTHLFLMTGGLLMVSFPVRAAWQRVGGRQVGLREFVPTIVSFTLLIGLVAFFTQYLAAYRLEGVFESAGDIDDSFEIFGIGTVFVTNTILLVPILMLVRRWDPPFGTFTFMYTASAAAMAGMWEFEAPLNVAAAVVAGLAADLLASRLRPRSDRRRAALGFAMAVPLFTWTAWFAGLALMDGVNWPAELWTGTIFLATLEGLALGLVAFPSTGVPLTSPVAAPATAAHAPTYS